MGRATDYDYVGDDWMTAEDVERYFPRVVEPDDALPYTPDRCSACFIALVVADVCQNESCGSNLRVTPGRRAWQHRERG